MSCLSSRVVALLALTACAGALLEDALDVIKLGKEIGEEVISSWDVLGRPFNATGGVELPLLRRRERLVLARLAGVARAIERVQLALEAGAGAGAAALAARGAARGSRLELRLADAADLLARVDAKDRQMREYVRLQAELERRTLEDFAQWCVSHAAAALPALLERLHALLAPPPAAAHLLARGLLHMLVDDLQEEHPDLCALQLSPHQLVYDMYNSVALAEIKGYAMMQFSWMLLRIYGKGNYTQEAELTRQRYNERASKAAAAARSALAMAKRDVYRCDPPQHQLGVTYEEVTRLLQGYIENEVDMNPKGTCKENCAFYTMTENYGCFKDMYCARQKTCNGRILECSYIDSDMLICPASPSSSRRYDWIEYENGRTLGRGGTCTRGATKVDSWWRWDLYHCSYCMCLCEDSADSSERFFSMRESLADISNNKVVTGLRLVKLGRVFHLQVHEGTLGERGRISLDNGTLNGRAGAEGWVPLQQFDPAEAGVAAGGDYHALTYEQRGLDLDELHAPPAHLLTGVRFRMHGPHLHLDIRATPFSFTSGRLAPEKSTWLSNDNTDGADQPRKKLVLVSPDVPTRARAALPVDSAHDQYLEFTHSDFEADAAQSTVPFLDIQPVLPMKGGAVASGAGVVHRGARGSGGFVALKLFTYDYSRHVAAAPPPPAALDEQEAVDFVPMPAAS